MEDSSTTSTRRSRSTASCGGRARQRRRRAPGGLKRTLVRHRARSPTCAERARSARASTSSRRDRLPGVRGRSAPTSSHALEALLDGGSYVGIATHDEWLIGEALGSSRSRGLEPSDYEFQMLLGVRDELGDELVAEGHRLRIYVPVRRALVRVLAPAAAGEPEDRRLRRADTVRGSDRAQRSPVIWAERRGLPRRRRRRHAVPRPVRRLRRRRARPPEPAHPRGAGAHSRSSMRSATWPKRRSRRSSRSRLPMPRSSASPARMRSRSRCGRRCCTRAGRGSSPSTGAYHGTGLLALAATSQRASSASRSRRGSRGRYTASRTARIPARSRPTRAASSSSRCRAGAGRSCRRRRSCGGCASAATRRARF